MITITQQSKLVGFEHGLIRKLSGFQKSHFVPDSLSPAGQEFIRKIGSEDLKERAEALFAVVRKEYGLKRKEIAYSCESGSASIRSAQFEIDLCIDQYPENLKQYRIATAISLVGDYDAAGDDRFSFCFNAYVDTLVVHFPKAIDIEEAIDRIEDLPDTADALDYEPDGSAFSLNFEERDLFLEVTETAIRFQLQRTRDLQALLQKSQEALEVLATAQLDPRLESFAN
ncbi:MAG: hypothetical protein AAGC73_10425 [Verrucomicrobiota bacterium]